MKPRIEQIGDATLYLGDCREIVPTISAHAVVSDPPYGVKLNTATASSKRHRGGAFSLSGSTDFAAIRGDDAPFDPAFMLPFTQVILWGGNHYCSRLPDASQWLVWDKRCGGAPDDNADCELAWTNLGGPARVHRQVWRGFFREGEENAAISGAKLHPTQKPIALMRWCVAMTTGAVLDPYMGSGTTAAACLQMGRPFVGVEIEPAYFDIACRRAEEAWKQPRLFAEPKRKPEQAAMVFADPQGPDETSVAEDRS